MNQDRMYIENNGLKLHYRVCGEGTPLVLLNSAFADLRIWQPVVDRLAQKYQVIQMDFRYSGETEQDGADYTLYEDMDCLIQALNLDKVNLLGMSAGGHAALEYAIQYPDKVDKIFLISTGLFGVAEDERKVARMQAFQGALYSGNVDEAVDLWTSMWLLGEGRTAEDVAAEHVELFQAITKHNLIQGMQFKMPRMMEPTVNASLGSLDHEVFHLVGSHDYQDVANACEVLRENIMNYQQLTVDAAHIIPLDVPDVVVENVYNFIQ